MLIIDRRIERLHEIVSSIFLNPMLGQTNRGHDGLHLHRMLAMREVLWPEIAREEPEAHGLELALDAAIVLHDLDRSVRLEGKGEVMALHRAEAARSLMAVTGLHGVADMVLSAIEKKPLPTGHPEKGTLARLLDDFDKADMGAIGIYRAIVHGDRSGHAFSRGVEDFDLKVPASRGIDSTKSLLDDLKFVFEWWEVPAHAKKSFVIQTPAIRRFVDERFARMRLFFGWLREEHRELGLLD